MVGDQRPRRKLRAVLLFNAAIFVLLGAVLFQPTSTLGQTAAATDPNLEFKFQNRSLPDFDTRTQVVAPSTTQINQANALGAIVRWNKFGTPASLVKVNADLATGLSGEAAAAARQWIRNNKALFRLSDASVTNLELMRDVVLDEGVAKADQAHVVMFRQKFGTLTSPQEGMITVGIVKGAVTYASSSAVGDAAAPAAATLSPQQAWLNAAANINFPFTLPQLTNVRTENGWTVFNVAGLPQLQRARLRALAIPGAGVRPVFEVNVLDVNGVTDKAYTMYVDGISGQVVFRQSRMQNFDDGQAPTAAPETTPFTGTYTATTCGKHTFAVAAGKTRLIVTATAALPGNDIVLKLLFGGNVIAESDTATSPEAIVYQPTTGVPAGTYEVQVCSFQGAAPVGVGNYAGAFTADDSPAPPAPNATPYNPRWKYFNANPPLDYSSTDTRVVGCWYTKIYTEAGPQPVPGCTIGLSNPRSRAPWDQNVDTNTPTNTTIGNNATTARSWQSPLTPSEQVRPISPQREYVYPWTNEWYNSTNAADAGKGCSPTVFASPTQNDTNAAVTNLFVQHDRMHDWSYGLGFRERTFNAQQNNFGNATESGTLQPGDKDPETGNAQAGAVSGGAPNYLGRDNANQITLQDGIPPITNMYLWQPIAAAFYAPCVDGDYDMSVIGHEYTHLTVSRMVGGPDAGPTGLQAGAMNESWADQSAVEYLNEYSFVPTGGENPFTVGAYVTGNQATGIRNFNMSSSPLNYSNVGYDIVGPQVHADGEIWSATNFDIRQALINKYNAQYPASNQDLQRFCANVQEPYPHCSGNRRWIQIQYSAFLLMQPAVSMLDARDAYLGADLLLERQYKAYYNAPNNQRELWRAFAARGFGQFATSNGSDDTEPVASFESPLETNEATVIFDVRADSTTGARIPNAKIYVGKYEARSTPIADTIGTTPVADSAKLLPGKYEFFVQAPGYGLRRFTADITGSRTFAMAMPTNWASASKGATATSNGTGGNAGTDRNLGFLIDDTEATSWARVGRTPGISGTEVIVDLGGAAQFVNKVQVSAYVRSFEDTNDPGGDTASQSRFAALRQFKIFTCNGAGKAADYCANPANYEHVFTSPANAFPAVTPRPTAPTLQLRSFEVRDTTATHVKLQVVSNQCTGTPAYQGDPDADPNNNSDCVSGSARDNEVRAAELQVFSK